MSYVFAGMIGGLLFGGIVFLVLLFVFYLLSCLYNAVKEGEFCAYDDTMSTLVQVAFIGWITVFVICVACGIWEQCRDKYVDFYNDEGQIVETYEITDYNTNYFGDSVTFYLKDGRTMVKQDCIYNVRFEGEEIK